MTPLVCGIVHATHRCQGIRPLLKLNEAVCAPQHRYHSNIVILRGCLRTPLNAAQRTCARGADANSQGPFTTAKSFLLHLISGDGQADQPDGPAASTVGAISARGTGEAVPAVQSPRGR